MQLIDVFLFKMVDLKNPEKMRPKKELRKQKLDEFDAITKIKQTIKILDSGCIGWT